MSHTFFYPYTTIELSPDAIKQATATVAKEWIRAVSDKTHPAHLEFILNDDFNPWSECPPKPTIMQTAHLPKIIDDLLVRPVWRRVMTRLDDNPVQRKDWAFSNQQGRTRLHSREFTPEYTSPVELELFEGLVDYMEDEIKMNRVIYHEFHRYGVTQENKIKVLDLGKLAEHYLSPFEGFAMVEISNLREDNTQIAHHPFTVKLPGNAQLTSTGFKETSFPYGQIIDVEDAQIVFDDERRYRNRPQRTITSRSLALPDEEDLLTLQILRDLNNSQKKVYPKQKLDEIKSYFTSGEHIRRNTETVQAYYTGVLFSQIRGYDEGHNGFFVSESDFDLPGEGLYKSELVKLAQTLYRGHIALAQHNQPVHLLKGNEKRQVVSINTTPQKPDCEISPFPLLQAYQRDFIERIARKNASEKPKENPFKNKGNTLQ